ncbi:hypothetical protein TrCOL_g8297 [Triparma columacea]|uniref:Uncharacterized protein n=1 Tax=Triparma columacea TaxID=722753 RepID=A0A9W7GG47_9STRA|nr:hypothetical protein TrCOL_g8297 [Triparma columacea]
MTINPRTTPRGRREKLIKNPTASLSATTKLDKPTVKRNTKADDKKTLQLQPKAERPKREVVKNTDPSSKFTSKSPDSKVVTTTVSSTLREFNLVVKGLEKYGDDEEERPKYLEVLEILVETGLFKRFWAVYKRKDLKDVLENLLASFISRELSALSSIQVLSSVNRSRHDEASKLALSTSDPAIVAAALRMRVPKKVREKLLLDNYDDKTIRQTVFATWKGPFNLNPNLLLAHYETDHPYTLPLILRLSSTPQGRLTLSESMYFPQVLQKLPTNVIRDYAGTQGFGVIVLLSGALGTMVRRGEEGQKDAVKGLCRILEDNSKFGSWGQ